MAATAPPSIPETTRRAFLAGSAVGFGSLVAGCSGGGAEDSGGSGRRIRGALGTIEVPDSVDRVVAVGQYRDADAAVALGVTPLLAPDLGTFIQGGVSPWVASALEERGKSAGDLNIANVEEMPYEEIARLRPELILATDRLALEREYDKLSRIAPTLSWQNGYNRDDWRLTTRRIGDALGRQQEAKRQLERTERAIADAKAANPQFAGKTFTLGPVTPDGVVNTINSPDDASAVFLSQLGLRLSPKVTAIEGSDIPGRAIISEERLDLIDADVLMLTFNVPGTRKELEASKVFQSIPAVQQGNYIALDLPTALAIGFPSALSVRYGLEQVVPQVRRVLA